MRDAQKRSSGREEVLALISVGRASAADSGRVLQTMHGLLLDCKIVEIENTSEGG